MKEFRILGVFLNGEPGDDEAIAFAARFAQMAGADSLGCVHVRANEDLSTAANGEEFQQRILSHFPQGAAMPHILNVSHQADVSDTLKCARDQNLDLVIVGRRLPHDQLAVGSSFVRLARKSPCSVLVVPDQSQPRFGRILVPSDGSEHAHLALQTALEIVRASGEPDPQIVVHHVFTVGYGYRYTGLTLPQAIKEREEVLRRHIEASVGDVDTSGVRFDVVCTSSERPAEAIDDLAASRGMEMIVAGSRGRTQSSAILLGSFVERLLINCPMPMMIVKRKGETLRFLGALLDG